MIPRTNHRKTRVVAGDSRPAENGEVRRGCLKVTSAATECILGLRIRIGAGALFSSFCDIGASVNKPDLGPGWALF